MCLNSNSGDTAPEDLEIEVTHVMANCMEHCHLPAERVLDIVQDEVFCLAGFMHSQQIAERTGEAKRKKTFEELVPEHYCNFTKVFSEEESQRLPDHQPSVEKNSAHIRMRLTFFSRTPRCISPCVSLSTLTWCSRLWHLPRMSMHGQVTLCFLVCCYESTA